MIDVILKIKIKSENVLDLTFLREVKKIESEMRVLPNTSKNEFQSFDGVGNSKSDRENLTFFYSQNGNGKEQFEIFIC
jgi:hypothetical protein